MKRSANKQFVVGAQTKFVTNNSNETRRVIYSRQQSLHQHKQNHNRLNPDGTLFFTRGGCVSCLRACFGARLLLPSYYIISTRTFRRALTASVDSCAEIMSAPSVA